MKRLSFLIVLALIAGACGTADESTDATGSCELGDISTLDLTTPDTLTVATGEPVFPPWMIDDDPSNGQGFESAIVYAVADELGFERDQVTWVRTGFSEAIVAGEKDYDFNVQQYSISADRDEVVDFSDGYYQVRQAIVGYDSSAAVGAASVNDLKSLRIGAQIGTTSLDYIENVIQPDEPAAVYDTNADAKAALDADQVDALVFDLPTAYYVTAVEIEGSAILGQLEDVGDTPEELGFLFEEGSALVPCVNQALDVLRDNGTLADIEQEWLAQGGDIPTISR